MSSRRRRRRRQRQLRAQHKCEKQPGKPLRRRKSPGSRRASLRRILDLPDDMLNEIISYLSLGPLAHLALTSRSFLTHILHNSAASHHLAEVTAAADSRCERFVSWRDTEILLRIERPGLFYRVTLDLYDGSEFHAIAREYSFFGTFPITAKAEDVSDSRGVYDVRLMTCPHQGTNALNTYLFLCCDNVRGGGEKFENQDANPCPCCCDRSILYDAEGEKRHIHEIVEFRNLTLVVWARLLSEEERGDDVDNIVGDTLYYVGLIQRASRGVGVGKRRGSKRLFSMLLSSPFGLVCEEEEPELEFELEPEREREREDASGENSSRFD